MRVAGFNRRIEVDNRYREDLPGTNMRLIQDDRFMSFHATTCISTSNWVVVYNYFIRVSIVSGDLLKLGKRRIDDD